MNGITMNEFDRGHLAGYREGRNDTLRGLNQEKPPGFWKRQARPIFVAWLILFSLICSVGRYRERMAAFQAVSISSAAIDEALYFVTLTRLKTEAQVREDIAGLERMIDGASAGR